MDNLIIHCKQCDHQYPEEKIAVKTCPKCGNTDMRETVYLNTEEEESQVNNDKQFLVKYIFHGNKHYDYKMFDCQKNATDFYLDLILEKNIPVNKIKLFFTEEIEVSFNLEVKNA